MIRKKIAAVVIVACMVLASLGIVIATISPVSAAEQAPPMQWSKTLAPISREPRDVIATSDGGYMIVGQAHNPSPFETDCYLVKLDGNGNVIWEKQYGIPRIREEAHSIAEAPDKGYVIAGYVDYSDLGQNARDAYFLKVDANGAKVWEKTYNLAQYDHINSIAAVANGYVASGFTSSTGGAGAKAYFIQLDLAGNKVWEKSIDNPNNIWTNTGAFTSDGGYLTAGATSSRDLSSYELYDGYLLKVDANGNKVWEQTYSATPDHYDILFSAQPTSDNGFVVGGTTGEYFSSKMWVFKTDSQGNKDWERIITVGSRSIINSIKQTTDGGYVAVGAAVDGPWKGYLTRLDSAGNTIWEQTFSVPSDSSYESSARLVEPTADGSYIVSGNTAAQSQGADLDIYIAKFGTATPNAAPTITSVTTPTDPTKVTDSVTLNTEFKDLDQSDTHAVIWTWGDGTTSAGTVTESNGAGTATGSHTYSAPGVYTVSVRVADNHDASAEATAQNFVVVYNPDGGFVTGGGWIASPAGAYAAQPDLTGKATFGFVSKYQKGANSPSGNTEFQFKVANLNFKSISYDWLVVAGSKAQYKGTGTINGAGSYKFMLSAIDGNLVGAGKPDMFRIKIWDDGGTVYDNLIGASDNADPTTALGGGSIVIHQ